MKKNKKTNVRVILGALVMVVTFMVVGISLAEAQESFRIGGNAPLTGKVANFGLHTVRGVNIALDDLAQKGWINGKKIEVIWEDNEYNPRKAVSAFNKLVSVDHVNCIILTGAPIVRATAPMAQQKKIVQLLTSVSNAEIRKSGNYTFKVMGGQVTESLAMAKFVKNTMTAKKAALLTVDTEYGKGGGDLFEKYFKQMGGEIVGREKTRPGERDYSTVITSLKRRNPEAFVMILVTADGAFAVKQARRMGIRAEQIIGSSGFFTPDFLNAVSEGAEGIYASGYIFDTEKGTPEMIAFGNKYKEKYKRFPSITDASSYDSIMLLAEALKNGYRTSEQIKSFLQKIHNYEGISGSINFDSYGESTAMQRIMQLRGDGFKEVYRFEKFDVKDLL